MVKKSKSTSKTGRSKKTTKRNRSTAAKAKPKRSTKSRNKKGSAFSKVIKTPSNGLTFDQKLDITGVVMLFLGIITLIGLLTTDHGKLLGTWVTILGQIVGWGLYILPIGLIVVGFWFILRNFERLPKLSLERIVGITFLFLFLLTTLHFILFPSGKAEAFALAKNGQGGGYIGAAINHALNAGLGSGGAAIILIAWFLIALAIVLDVSVAGLFKWVSPLILKIQDYWDERQGQKLSSKPGYTPVPLLKENGSLSQSQGSPVPEPPALINKIDVDESTPHSWSLPPIDEILERGLESQVDAELDQHRAHLIEETLDSFGAPARVVEISRGPTITQFGVEPLFIESRGKRTRVRIGKISALADDLALALAATSIRIQAPVPGKGYVGIEVPNEEITLVALRDSIESKAFKRLEGRPLRFTIGQDVSGNAVAADLAAMPHLLIAGTTGSGKSVCVNALISCLLMNNTPDDLRMIMVDPKRVELTGYDGIPHLLTPVVVELKRVIGALQWITREMDQRYHRFSESGARNLVDYNQRMESQGERKLPYLLVIIDELADLMMLAPDETERTITRLAQMARATGIHMIISTQRPSVDIITGLIKANFPARIAFAVASSVDSRVIIDQPGAERLLGRGDMLFQAPNAASPIRLQGVFVSDQELLRLVQFWRSQNLIAAPSSVSTAAGGVPDAIPRGIPLKQIPLWEEMKAEEKKDPLLDESIDLVRRRGRASISMLQRRMRIGYTRAARLIETMEERGIISEPMPGSQHREILDYGSIGPPADDD